MFLVIEKILRVVFYLICIYPSLIYIKNGNLIGKKHRNHKKGFCVFILGIIGLLMNALLIKYGLNVFMTSIFNLCFVFAVDIMISKNNWYELDGSKEAEKC